MSKIEMELDRVNGSLALVQTITGKYYWISTANVEHPLGIGWETAAVRCRKDGYTHHKAFENAKVWLHGKKPENIYQKHLEICNNLEKML